MKQKETTVSYPEGLSISLCYQIHYQIMQFISYIIQTDIQGGNKNRAGD